MDDEFDEWQEALPMEPASQSFKIEQPLQIKNVQIQQQTLKAQNEKQEIVVKEQLNREKSLEQKLDFNENNEAQNYDDLLKYKSQPILTFQNFNSNYSSKQTVDLQQGEYSNFNTLQSKQVHLVENYVQQTNAQLNVNFQTNQRENEETNKAEQSNERPTETNQNDEDQFGQFQEPTFVTPQQIVNSKDLSHSEHERYEREKQKQLVSQQVKITQNQNENIKMESYPSSQMNSSGVFSKPKIKKPVYSQVEQKRATEIIKKIPDYSFIYREQFIK